jgi:hypothetical protein
LRSVSVSPRNEISLSLSMKLMPSRPIFSRPGWATAAWTSKVAIGPILIDDRHK